MPVNRENLVRDIISAIGLVQEQSGRDAAVVGAETRPFEEVDGFDSLNALEVMVQVAEVSKIEVPDKVINKLVKESHSTVAEWADRLASLLEGE